MKKAIDLTNKRIIIIGGGLSGLTLAYLLSKSKYNVTVLEASRRLGGRIQTKMGKLETPLELGATWFSDIHQNLLALLDELGVNRFFQFSKGISLFQTKSFEPAQSFYVPESESPSYRIAGGTQKIIEILSKKLADVDIHLNAKILLSVLKSIDDDIFVLKIKDKNSTIVIEADNFMAFISPIKF